MNWLFSLLGREKLILEIIEMVRDLVKDEYEQKTWTLVSDVTPPEKKLLLFRGAGSFILGNCKVEKKRILIQHHGDPATSGIGPKQYNQYYWMHISDPIDVYNTEEAFTEIVEKKINGKHKKD